MSGITNKDDRFTREPFLNLRRPCSTCGRLFTNNNDPNCTTCSARCADKEATPERKKQAEQFKRILCELFPQCFIDRSRGHKVPIKDGILRDLVKRFGPQADSDLLNWAIELYMNDDDYRMALRAGAVRVDLDGNPSGWVSKEFAASIRQRLARRGLVELTEDEVRAAKRYGRHRRR